MHTCPKCSGWMTGPTYNPGVITPAYPYRRSDSLVYRCTRCGYRKHEPTHDSKGRATDWSELTKRTHPPT